jgi:hypothetical protein
MSLQIYEEEARKLNNILFKEEIISLKEKTLIEIIKKYDLKQRLLLRICYNKIFPDNNLITDFSSKLSGQFAILIINLFMTRIDIECIEFKKIFDGVNPNKNILLESLSINPFWFNQKVARRFFELYKKDLKTEIMKHFHDFTKDILITCLNTKRNDNEKNIDDDEIEEKVKLALNTSPEELIKNNEILINIFGVPSPKELILISKKFKEKKGEHFLKYLENKLKEDEYLVIKEVIYNICRPSENFAYKLKNSIKGVEVNVESINRILVMRNEVDINEIKKFYNKINGKDLPEEISDIFTGGYKELILYLYNK